MYRWKRYQPTKESPWDARKAVHLFRRAAFGASMEEIEQALREGVDATIDRIIAGELTRPESAASEATSALLVDSAIATNQAIRLKSAWILRIIASSDPFRERVTLMWHDHFATSNAKLSDCYAMWQQNQLFRETGLGSFGDLLGAVLHDPAMLRWLDAPSNVKQAPNENLARELMELFTLGVGNYSEDDVKEVARALTGRTLAEGVTCIDDHSSHDVGVKTIFGESGEYGPNDLPELLTARPPCARRITWRVCQSFLGEDVVSNELHLALALQYQKNDWTIRKLVETVLRSESFFASRGKRISPPIDFVAAAIRVFRASDRPSPAILADWLAEMGQDLFVPPNVAGWPGGEAWISPQRMIARMRFAAALESGELRSPVEPVRPTLKNTNTQIDAQLRQLLVARPLCDSSHAVLKQNPNSIATLLSLPEAQMD